MTDASKIGGIIATAPLWNKATEAELLWIIKCLSDASYHFADDSGSEWSTAYSLVRKAAAEINRLKLTSRAIKALHDHAPQLVGLDALQDNVLADARGAS